MKNIITSGLVLTLFCTLIINFAPSNRIKEFQTDVGSIIGTSLETYLQNRRDSRFGTSAFRYFILLERYEYLKKNPQKFWFGYGFIRERNLVNNPFSIMVSDKYTLDIGDISWAYILVRYGMLGIILMGVIVFMSIKCFVRRIENGFLNKIGFMYMVTVLVLSFGDSFLSSPVVFLIPYMISILAHPVTQVSSCPKKGGEDEKDNPHYILT